MTTFEKMKQALVAAATRAGLTQYEIYAQSEESISAETLKDEISSFSSSPRITLADTESSFVAKS